MYKKNKSFKTSASRYGNDERRNNWCWDVLYYKVTGFFGITWLRWCSQTCAKICSLEVWSSDGKLPISFFCLYCIKLPFIHLATWLRLIKEYILNWVMKCLLRQAKSNILFLLTVVQYAQISCESWFVLSSFWTELLQSTVEGVNENILFFGNKLVIINCFSSLQKRSLNKVSKYVCFVLLIFWACLEQKILVIKWYTTQKHNRRAISFFLQSYALCTLQSAENLSTSIVGGRLM